MRSLLFLLLPLLMLTQIASAREAREEQRIQFLIESVESLKGAVFIRNGSEYSASDAGKHLRLKLSKGGERVKTAEDFIIGCASKSSFSGQPYQIRLPDGKTMETAAFFQARLREYDTTHSTPAAAR